MIAQNDRSNTLGQKTRILDQGPNSIEDIAALGTVIIHRSVHTDMDVKRPQLPCCEEEQVSWL